MLCIAAFIVLLAMGAVSAKYRRLLGRAAACTWRRVTLRPCDTTFREDLKNSMLAPLAVRAPALVKPASVAIEVLAWVMVLSLVLSLYIVGRSGLNLFVYGTCDKQNAQACTLSAQVCSVGTSTPGFWESVGSGDVIGAFGNEFAALGDTISTIPSRLRDWDAADYASPYATYLGGYEAGRETVLEVIDPGCRYCAELFRNIEESGIAERRNVTYLAFPIAAAFGDKFPHSALIARYLTAIQITEKDSTAAGGEPTDWAILHHLFTQENPAGTGWQEWFNEDASADEAEAQLQEWLREAGYDDAGVAAVQSLSQSDQVADVLADIRTVVTDEIRTVAIPTLIADGRLRSGVVSVDDLAGMK